MALFLATSRSQSFTFRLPILRRIHPPRENWPLFTDPCRYRSNEIGVLVARPPAASFQLRYFAAQRQQKTANEWCSQIFDAIDFNRNGYLDRAELQKIVFSFGENDLQAEKRWRKLLDTVDTNHDNQISKEEYCENWIRQTRQHMLDANYYTPAYEGYLRNYIEMLRSKTEALYASEKKNSRRSAGGASNAPDKPLNS